MWYIIIILVYLVLYKRLKFYGWNTFNKQNIFLLSVINCNISLEIKINNYLTNEA